MSPVLYRMLRHKHRPFDELCAVLVNPGPVPPTIHRPYILVRKEPLTMHNIRTLITPSMLDDQIINTYGELLQLWAWKHPHIGTIDVICSTYTGTEVMQMGELSSLEGFGATKFCKYFGQDLRRRDIPDNHLGNVGRIVLPIHDPDTLHWSLCIISFVDVSIEFIDSLCETRESLTRGGFKTARNALKYMLEAMCARYEYEMWIEIWDVNVLPQRPHPLLGQIDSGVFLTQHMKVFIKGGQERENIHLRTETAGLTLENMEEIRKGMARELLVDHSIN